MLDEMPDRIYVTKEDDDFSAQILGDLYAQHEPDGMVGHPTVYVRGDWGDMDTAPHDGTDILTWDGNDHAVLFYSQHGNGWTCGNPKIKYNPTHWMPLPAPPAE